MLAGAGDVIDYLALHSYPVYDWGRFETFATRHVSLGGQLRSIENALRTQASPADAERIRFLLTETNSADWMGHPLNTGWSNASSFGHGLVLVDILARSATHPRMDAALVWNTRWMNNAGTPELWDAADANDSLLPTGRAVQIAGQMLQGLILTVTTSDPAILAYASRDDTGTLRLLLINRSPEARSFSLGDGFPTGEKPVAKVRWQPGAEGPDGPGEFESDPKLVIGDAISLPPWTLLGLEFRNGGARHPRRLSRTVHKHEQLADGLSAHDRR